MEPPKLCIHKSDRMQSAKLDDTEQFGGSCCLFTFAGRLVIEDVCLRMGVRAVVFHKIINIEGYVHNCSFSPTVHDAMFILYMPHASIVALSPAESSEKIIHGSRAWRHGWSARRLVSLFGQLKP